MALNLQRKEETKSMNLYVRLAKWIEMKCGAWADGHLCVSKAMSEELKRNWGIK